MLLKAVRSRDDLKERITDVKSIFVWGVHTEFQY